MFAVVDSTLHLPQTVADLDHLYQVGLRGSRQGLTVDPGALYPLLKPRRDRFAAVTAEWWREPPIMTLDDEQREVAAVAVADDYFRVLGAKPIAGRTFAAGEASSAGTAVISEQVWRRDFGGVRDLGSIRLLLDARSYTVVGVMPRLRAAVTEPEVFLLADQTAPAPEPGATIYVRLAAGVAQAAAEQEIATIARSVAATDHPTAQAGGIAASLYSLGRASIAIPGFRQLMVAGAIAVLLIACVNLGMLILARQLTRRRELAMQLALGAPRHIATLQASLEALLLTLLGGVSGLGIATVLVRALAGRMSPGLQASLGSPWMSGRVIAFAVIAPFIVAALCGVLAARRAPRERHGIGRAMSGAAPRTFRAFVVVQFGSSMLLLVVVAMLVRAIVAVNRFDPGVALDGLYQTRLNLARGVPIPRAVRDRQDSTEAAARLRATSVANQQILLAASRLGNVAYAATSFDAALPGRVVQSAGSPQPVPLVSYHLVSSDFFRTLGVHVVKGRNFEPGDAGGDVAVVDAALAARLWPDGRAMGDLRVGSGRHARTVRVVGIAPSFALAPPRQAAVAPTGELYVLSTDSVETGSSLFVRARQGGASLPDRAAAAFRAVAPSVAFTRLAPVAEEYRVLVERQGFVARILGIFALLGAALAGIGLYATATLSVSRRRQEFAIRIALGAPSAAVRRLVLREGLLLAGIGAGVGVVLSLWSARVIRAAFYGVEAPGPQLLLGLTMVLALLAVVAGWLPARRAATQPPADTLREV